MNINAVVHLKRGMRKALVVTFRTDLETMLLKELILSFSLAFATSYTTAGGDFLKTFFNSTNLHGKTIYTIFLQLRCSGPGQGSYSYYVRVR